MFQCFSVGFGGCGWLREDIFEWVVLVQGGLDGFWHFRLGFGDFDFVHFGFSGFGQLQESRAAGQCRTERVRAG